MQLSKQNNPVLLLTLISFLHPSLAVTPVLSGTGHVGQCHRFAAGLSNTSLSNWHLSLPSLPLDLHSPSQQMSAGSFRADASVASPALSPAFEVSMKYPRFALACLCWAWNPSSQYWVLALIILFLLCIKCSWILPFNPTWLEFVFILCSFLGMPCLCPAVVCYNDARFLFISLAGNKGWWGNNAGHSPPRHYCIFQGHGVVCTCRRERC